MENLYDTLLSGKEAVSQVVCTIQERCICLNAWVGTGYSLITYGYL